MEATLLRKTEDQAGIKGEHLFALYDTTSEDAHAIERELNTLVLKRESYHPSLYAELYADLTERLNRYKTAEKMLENLVPTVGRALFAQRLANTLTYTGVINYGALGTGATAPTNSDTQLGTEVFRKVIASQSASSNVATIKFFFTKGDTNGTYTEWGTFIDGTGTANSGQLFSRLLTGGWAKTSSETMTVISTYTIS